MFTLADLLLLQSADTEPKESVGFYTEERGEMMKNLSILLGHPLLAQKSQATAISLATAQRKT